MAESNNDDRTVVRKAPEVPAAQAAPAVDAAPHNTLPVGTQLGEFEIIGLVGEGGFGIVYLAEDHSLERKVALKEYMPSSLAARGNNSSVVVRSARHQETFEIGLRSFVNEARLLAQFDHPALVKVYRFWEANGTAYMAMPYYKGKTLRDALKEQPNAPDESWIKKILMPVMEALEIIHKDHCFHRDIAPDNIMLLGDERPVLLDFGAARRVISDMTQALTVILKPGYAPIEQYAEMPGMKQGPWTDIYALAAVVYFMIQGRTPPPAVGRMMQDSYQPLAQLAAGSYSEVFLSGVDKCLSVKAEERPQTIAEMRELLGLGLASPLFEPAGATQFSPARASPQADTRTTAIRPAASGAATTAEAPRKSNTLVIAAGTAALGVALIGGGYWFFTQKTPPKTESVATQTVPTEVAPSAASKAPASATTPPPEPAPSAQQESKAGTPPPTEKPAEPPVVALPPAYASLGEAVTAITNASDSHLSFKLNAPATVPIGTNLKLSLTAKSAGYLYLFLWDRAKNKFTRVFPNALDTDNTLKAGTTFSLPRTKLATPWTIPAQSQGDWQMVALLSATARDFGKAALNEEGDFLAASSRDLETRLSQRAGLNSLIGEPKCESANSCEERYAVSVATIARVVPPPPPAAPAEARPQPAQTAQAKKAPAATATPNEAPSPKKSASPAGDKGTDSEREYMKQLNKDLDKLLGK